MPSGRLRYLKGNQKKNNHNKDSRTGSTRRRKKEDDPDDRPSRQKLFVRHGIKSKAALARGVRFRVSSSKAFLSCVFAFLSSFSDAGFHLYKQHRRFDFDHIILSVRANPL